MTIPRGISEASASRIVAAGALSLIVTGGLAFGGLEFSREYTASVGLLGTLETGPARSPGSDHSSELPAVALAALSDDAVAQIDQQVHPYTFVASKFFPKWTASRLRSQLSVESIYSGSTMGAIAIVYSGNNRQTALAVASAAADLLLQSQDAVPLTPAVARPPASTPASVKTSEPPPEGATPVQPPDESAAQLAAAESNAAQMKAIRELRGQLATIARNSQQLENKIQSGSDSLAAIEQEKEHLRQAELVVSPAPKPVPPPPDPKRALLQSKLAAYEKVLAALRDRYTEDYPDVINARERVEELGAEIAKLPNPVTPVERAPETKRQSDLPQRVAALDERERPIKANLEEVRAMLKASEDKAAQLRRFVTELPAKSAAARTAGAQTAIAHAAPTPPEPMAAPETRSGTTAGRSAGPGAGPRDISTFASKFSIATPAEIRSSEEILSPEAITAVSIAGGLGAGFACLAFGSRRSSRRPREEAEPEAAVV